MLARPVSTERINPPSSHLSHVAVKQTARCLLPLTIQWTPLSSCCVWTRMTPPCVGITVVGAVARLQGPPALKFCDGRGITDQPGASGARAGRRDGCVSAPQPSGPATPHAGPAGQKIPGPRIGDSDQALQVSSSPARPIPPLPSGFSRDQQGRQPLSRRAGARPPPRIPRNFRRPASTEARAARCTVPSRSLSRAAFLPDPKQGARRGLLCQGIGLGTGHRALAPGAGAASRPVARLGGVS